MSYLHQFGPDDILTNRMVTRPNYEFVMGSGSIYLNNERGLGQNLPTGSLSLYEYNVDRPGTTNTTLITPYITKGGNHLTIYPAGEPLTGSAFNAHVGNITGSYPMTSSITRRFYAAEAYNPDAATSTTKTVRDALDTYVDNRKEIIALKNVMNNYRNLSNSYSYSGSYITGDVNMIQIPSIFYDNGIEKGSLSLKFYFTGTLIDEVIDSKKNGELISTMGGASGTTVGVVLYNEGFLLLTSSVTISTNEDVYAPGGSLANPSWLYYGAYGTYASASLFSLSFNGIQKIPSMTMFAEAKAGEVNNSQNPTWISSSDAGWRDQISVSEAGYVESDKITIKNTVQSDYCNYEDEFQKQVFITEIGIFDEDKNLIGIAKLANPVLKKEADSYMFKLNLDM